MSFQATNKRQYTQELAGLIAAVNRNKNKAIAVSTGAKLEGKNALEFRKKTLPSQKMLN